MVDSRFDQAEGLRRLLDRGDLRVVSVTSGCPGVGKTSVVVNVAAALAARGSRVLVIDENYGPANVAGLLGVRARYDLNHVMRGSCTLDDALLDGPRGVSILSAACGARALPALRMLERERLIASFGRLDGRYDVALIDTACGNAGAAGLFGAAVRDTIVVSSATADALTASYALIKRLREAPGVRRFYMLLNRVACEKNARVAADNLKHAARGYLATSLECLGNVVRDESLPRAACGFQSVVEANPAAPSARGFGRIADAIAAWPRGGPRREEFDSLMQRLLAGSRFVYANSGV
jgi:flagellar biosynthesis protein FlhG